MQGSDVSNQSLIGTGVLYLFHFVSDPMSAIKNPQSEMLKIATVALGLLRNDL